MKHLKIEQKSPEWWAYKVGRVSGTRTGQLISTRENSLIDDMMDEMLDGFVKPNDFQTDEMLFGIENEEKALDLYSKISGIDFKKDVMPLLNEIRDGLYHFMVLGFPIPMKFGDVNQEYFWQGISLPKLSNHQSANSYFKGFRKNKILS